MSQLLPIVCGAGMSDQPLNPYAATEVPDEPQYVRQALYQRRPWGLIALCCIFIPFLGAGLVGLLPRRPIASAAGLIPPTVGFVLAGVFLLFRDRRRGDWFFYGSFVWAIIGLGCIAFTS